jgi:glycosyltransferase involved in cell wall biosynthesis
MTSCRIKDLVSVIMPTRNRPRLTLEAAKSVFAQTYRPLELIVVDDGSTDNTVQVLREWTHDISADTTFKVIIIEQGQHGAPTARNNGWAVAHGQFIQFLDSDDILHPEKIKLQAEALTNNPRYNFALCKYAEVTDNEIKQFAAIEKQVALEFIEKVTVYNVPKTVWCCLYRRETIEKNGPWNTKLARWQDWDYTSRMYCYQQLKAIHIPHVLYLFRQHVGTRIGELMYSQKGAAHSIQSLKTIQNTYEVTNSLTEEARHRFARFYISIALQAMKYNQHDLAKDALRQAKTLNKRLLFGIKCWLVSIGNAFLGDGVCARSIYAYGWLSEVLNRIVRRSPTSPSRFEG